MTLGFRIKFFPISYIFLATKQLMAKHVKQVTSKLNKFSLSFLTNNIKYKLLYKKTKISKYLIKHILSMT